MTTFEEISQGIITCLQAQEDSRFAAGDLLLLSEVPLKQMAASVGRSESYLYQLKQTSRTFPGELRAKDQTWSLHRLAASADEPQSWLDRAVDEGWSVRELRKALIEDGQLSPRAKKKACPNCGYKIG